MKFFYCIIQIIFTLIGSIGLFAVMFFNNIDLKEILSNGFATYILLKNLIAIGLLSLYTVVVTVLSITLLWLISKIFNCKKYLVIILRNYPYFRLYIT